MISEKDRKKIIKILKEIKSLEGKFLIWSNIDIDDSSFSDSQFIREFEKMCSIRSQIKDLKDQLALLYVTNA